MKLPDVQLDRKQYMEIKKAMQLIGGKWKGGKVAGFVFASDPTELLSQIANGEKRNLKKEFQFFETPDKVIYEMMGYADIQDHDTILEPSAGQGAIVRHINNVCGVIPDCYELMDVNRRVMRDDSTLKYKMLGSDFLTDVDNHKRYTKIIANPPFSKNQDIDHLYKMYEKLVKWGRVVSVMSKHWQFSQNKKETQFREWLSNLDSVIVDIEPGAFKKSGTSVASCIIIINKNE